MLGLSVIVLLFCLSVSDCVLRFLFFSRVGKFFFKQFFLRSICKLFDKALVCVLACEALAMCLQNALACSVFIVPHYQNTDSNSLLLNLFLKTPLPSCQKLG
jgi:hypothetical protein